MGNTNYLEHCTFHCNRFCCDVRPNTNTSTEKGENLKIADKNLSINPIFFIKKNKFVLGDIRAEDTLINLLKDLNQK